jgi:general secretion pathway protein E
VSFRLARRAALETALDQFGAKPEEARGREVGTPHAADLDQLRDMASDAPVIRLVNRTILQAMELGASDIHIEPFEREVRLRFRVDGALRAGDPIPHQLRAAVISRLKIMAHLDIAETRLPQDGRIRTVVSGRELDLRVATTPTLHGEGVVIRLLDRSALILDFDGLGFDARATDEILKLIRAPNGVVLVTGPTGSGKTTTLYAALSALNDATAKIVTVEDPVEYQLPGITQIQVQPSIGLDFAHVLRSILRQNPDIVMVGEIRDRETADIAIRTALTGHLVLATLHTNSAAAAMTRLRDMGVPSYLIASVVRGAAAQRLVRKLCDCAQPDPRAAQLLGADMPAQGHAFRRAAGCARCGGTGYRGRTTLLEVLRATPALREMILNDGSDAALFAAAERDGMRSLRAHGIARAAKGETSLDEVLRIVAEV